MEGTSIVKVVLFVIAAAVALLGAVGVIAFNLAVLGWLGLVALAWAITA